jgi:hypothetical protein
VIIPPPHRSPRPDRPARVEIDIRGRRCGTTDWWPGLDPDALASLLRFFPFDVPPWDVGVPDQPSGEMDPPAIGDAQAAR